MVMILIEPALYRGAAEAALALVCSAEVAAAVVLGSHPGAALPFRPLRLSGRRLRLPGPLRGHASLAIFCERTDLQDGAVAQALWAFANKPLPLEPVTGITNAPHLLDANSGPRNTEQFSRD